MKEAENARSELLGWKKVALSWDIVGLLVGSKKKSYKTTTRLQDEMMKH